MYKAIFIALLIFLGLGSCEKNNEIYPECLDQFGDFEPVNKPGKGQVEFIFYENSDLAVNEDDGRVYFEKVPGDRFVFRYQFTGDEDPNIADDEYSEVIWFAVDPKGDSFDIYPDEFENSGALFGRMCFCVDGGFHWIKKGCIHGRLVGEGKWEVSIAIQSETNHDTYTRMIRGDFLASL